MHCSCYGIDLKNLNHNTAMAPHEGNAADSSKALAAEGKEDILKEICMHTACNDALLGVLQGHGGPFGAMVCCSGRTIAVAHNTVLEDHDPTCHAEMNAIR